MSFILTLHDRNGKELNLGDIVKISDGKGFQFFSEVTFLPGQQCLAPFHTFSFHSFEKVDKVPKEATPSTNEDYKIWYLPDPETDYTAKDHEKYLMSWRECEDMLEKRCYRIKPAKGQTQLELK